MRRSPSSVALLFWAALCAGASLPTTPVYAQAPAVAGIAFTPHREYPEHDIWFRPLIDDLATTGATHISMVVQWAQEDVAADVIEPDEHDTQDDEVVRALIRYSRSRGLKVMVFPIIWVQKRAMGEWRGTLRPQSLERWWSHYERFIMHYAELAAEEGATMFSVGSELGSMERHRARWLKLIEKVRGRFKGELLYSANWDHYDQVTFWDALDFVGMTAYYELTDRNEADQATLTAAWVKIRDTLLAWQQRVGRPIILTEVGYPSQDGGARQPWNYTLHNKVDHEEQRRAYEAFVTAWSGEEALGGVFFWNWYGLGGEPCRDYTPRGKPAEQVIRRWYTEKPKARPKAAPEVGPLPKPAIP